MKEKKGQIQVTFNWVYILIAGALILLFFVGIVYRQKAVSEERLSGEVVRILESILTGASVSEKTKNFIDTSGLAEYTLYFKCEDDVGEFGIDESTYRSENNIDPIFAPNKIRTSRLIVWSLPYRLPFKVIDFLFVTSANTKYYLRGGTADFVNEFVNATEGFNVEYLIDENDYINIDPGKNYQIRIADFSGIDFTMESIPENLKKMDNDKVTAVSFSNGGVTYYKKLDNNWKKLNRNPIPIISIFDERSAATYAAVFAGNDVSYQCNMKKAFRRLEYLMEIYGGSDLLLDEAGGKVGEMLTYYQERPEETLTSECKGLIRDYDHNLISALSLHRRRLDACSLEYIHCQELTSSAQQIRGLNQELMLNCITLY